MSTLGWINSNPGLFILISMIVVLVVLGIDVIGRGLYERYIAYRIVPKAGADREPNDPMIDDMIEYYQNVQEDFEAMSGAMDDLFAEMNTTISIMKKKQDTEEDSGEKVLNFRLLHKKTEE